MSAKVFIAVLLQVSSLLLISLLFGCGGTAAQPACPVSETSR
jgi:uncharacterized membrane protein YeiB